MKLIIVRHVQTIENVKGIVQGLGKGTMTNKGKAQLRILAKELKDKEIDVIYSSDLSRAADTAKAIAKYHDVPVHYLKALRERHPGIFHGKTRREFFAVEKASGLGKARFKPKGGEDLSDLMRRVRRFCKGMDKRDNDKTVLIVTHGWVSKALYSIYMHVPAQKAVTFETNNAGMIVIDVGKARNRMLKDTMFKSSKGPKSSRNYDT